MELLFTSALANFRLCSTRLTRFFGLVLIVPPGHYFSAVWCNRSSTVTRNSLRLLVFLLLPLSRVENAPSRANAGPKKASHTTRQTSRMGPFPPFFPAFFSGRVPLRKMVNPEPHDAPC
jgi:hypothetical protein